MVNYKRNVGSLAVDRYQFQGHVDGYAMNHHASSIYLNPTVTMDVVVSDVQTAIENLVAKTVYFGRDLYSTGSEQYVVGISGNAGTGVVSVSANEFHANKDFLIKSYVNGTSSTSVTLMGSPNTYAGSSGGSINLISGSGKASGGQIYVNAGQGDNFGGSVNINSGSGGLSVSGSRGGSVGLYSGNAQLSGGDISLMCGYGTTNGGNVQIFSGTGQTGGNISLNSARGQIKGGDVNLSSGSGNTSLSESNGGNVNLTTGAGNNAGGDLFISCGAGNISGGNVIVNSGSGNAVAGSYGGEIIFSSGNGKNKGGDTNIECGYGENKGGSVYISSGAVSSTSTNSSAVSGEVTLCSAFKDYNKIHLKEVRPGDFVMSFCGKATDAAMPAGTGSGVILLNPCASAPYVSSNEGAIIYCDGGEDGSVCIRAANNCDTKIGNPNITNINAYGSGAQDVYTVFYGSVFIPAGQTFYTLHHVILPNSSLRLKGLITGLSKGNNNGYHAEVAYSFHKDGSSAISNDTGVANIIEEPVNNFITDSPAFMIDPYDSTSITFRLPKSADYDFSYTYRVERLEISNL